MSTQHNTSTSSPSEYTFVEIAEGALGGLSAVAVGAAALPGFLLTAPGLILFLLPVIAVGVLTALAVAAVALATLPVYVGWRLVRRAWRALPSLRAPRFALPRRAAGLRRTRVFVRVDRGV